MKKVKIIGLLLIIVLSSCQEQSNCQDNCVTDTRLINEWEIFQECLCYEQGGDFIWRSVDEKYLWVFHESCMATKSGVTHTNCNRGKYSVEKNKLIATWICSESNTSPNEYQFSISQNGDTLTLKGFVDEGYIGLKFIKKI